MKPDFASALRCPACRRDSTLVLTAASEDGVEAREGSLRCSACGTRSAQLSSRQSRAQRK